MEEEYIMPLEAIEYLERLYPDKIITAELSSYEQGLINGVITLIRTLRGNYEIANNTEEI